MIRRPVGSKPSFFREFSKDIFDEIAAYMKWLKNLIRKKMKTRRMGLDNHFIHFASQQISQSLFLTSHYVRANKIAFYSPFQGEVMTARMIERTHALGKQCYLPFITPQKLSFIRVEKNSPLFPNRYGILEPSYDPNKIIDPQALDLVLLPLIAFDLKGHRLGMGMGYYDKTFSFKRNTCKPYLLGLGYEFQCSWKVPFSSLDVSLDGVITEKNSHDFTTKN